MWKLFLVLLLLSCTASAQICQPGAGVWTEYSGAFFGTHTYQSLVVDSSGRPTGPLGSTYTTITPDATHGQSNWGGSIEFNEIVTAPNGDRWGVVKAYGSTTAYYPVETIKASWTNLDTGQVVDLTGISGTPMMPYLI